MKEAIKPDPKDWRPPTVLLVGLGMGRDDLSTKVLQWLERAEVLAGGKRHLDSFPEFKGEKVPLESTVESFLERLDRISAQKRTAVLASGDPFYFGIGRRLVGAMGRERVIAFPNITSVQALFAKLGEGWEEVKRAEPSWRRAITASCRLAARRAIIFQGCPLYRSAAPPGWIAQQLLGAGMAERTLIVAEDLGLPTENIERLSLEEAASRSFSPLNLVVIAAEGPVNVEQAFQPAVKAGIAGWKACSTSPAGQAFPFLAFRSQPLSTKRG